ncbi:MAG: quinone-dependent dihydroorotate dehydrogenase [Actinomycetota bacterium]|nr:quinone-dependent dihydroorotate dehydrogenase [Actinomycetota bacterium]
MIYRLFFRLILRHIDAETAHTLATVAVGVPSRIPAIRAVLRRLLGPRDPVLRVQALGMTFPSPLGVAAGMDKNATWFEGLGAIGFGFVEVGTVTAHAQAGNDRPRIERFIADRALINWMGFPNKGADAAATRLRSRHRGETIVGVNLGKSKSTPFEQAAGDYRYSIRRLVELSDYVVLNVSSPNTPGLRGMQASEHLQHLVAEVRAELRAAEMDAPLLVKIGPDLSDEELDEIADVSVALELDGLIAVNTTVDRGGLISKHLDRAAPAGVSGAPLKPRAVEVLRRLRARVGDSLVLVAVGGIENAEDAWERILAGATLVQAYSGFVYGGPLWPHRTNRDLARLVRGSGGSSVAAMVGAGTVSDDPPAEPRANGSTALGFSRTPALTRTSTPRAGDTPLAHSWHSAARFVPVATPVPLTGPAAKDRTGSATAAFRADRWS